MPFLVGRARALNEHLPVHVAGTVVDLIRDTLGHTEGARLAVLEIGRASCRERVLDHV